MLLDYRNSLLLMVDMQARLAPAINDIDSVRANAVTLLTAANRLEVPVLVTEHCPNKIGPTVGEVAAILEGATVVRKHYFSALAETAIAAQTASLQRQQIIVAGIETHVCVLQTTLDLCNAGYACYLVEDATGTRKPVDKQTAVARLRDNGVQIVTTEMVLFEWLRRGDSDEFKQLFPLIRNR